MPDGVTFRSHLDGSKHRLTPERAVDIQHLLDATISMVLDECTPFPATHEQARASMALSMRWAARSREAFVRHVTGYALFGIVQGGVYADLRAQAPPRRCGDWLRGLRDWRPGRGRGPGSHVRRAGFHRAAFAAMTRRAT